MVETLPVPFVCSVDIGQCAAREPPLELMEEGGMRYRVATTPICISFLLHSKVSCALDFGALLRL